VTASGLYDLLGRMPRSRRMSVDPGFPAVQSQIVGAARLEYLGNGTVPSIDSGSLQTLGLSGRAMIEKHSGSCTPPNPGVLTDLTGPRAERP